jgi:protein gp37
MQNSSIEWTDHTFNPWHGCTKVSAGCANCYAERQARRFPDRLGQWGKGAPRVPASEAQWKEPLKWERQASKALNHWDYQRKVCETKKIPYTATKPQRPRVFCASFADWLDDEGPVEWLARLLKLIAVTPHLDWLLLTKRLENFHPRLMAAYSAPGMGSGKPEMDWVYHWAQGTHTPPNVWLGTSVEDQAAADLRIPQLHNIPARVRFLSCEPLLGPIDFECFPIPTSAWPSTGIGWVIAGGESGANARPMHPAWVRSLRDQCHNAGVPFLFKQWGEFVTAGSTAAIPALDPNKKLKGHRFPDGTLVLRVGKKNAGRTLDGQIHHAFPAL